MTKLYIHPKERDIFQFPLKKEKISVGRFSGNDIHLHDTYSSGYYAFIYAGKKGYVIQDNNSKNGTFLNGKRIPGKTLLKKGDIF